MKKFAYFASVIEGEERGLHGFSVDVKTGRLRPVSVIQDSAMPMFVVAHPRGHVLYAVYAEQVGDERKGYVASYAIDASSGRLTETSRFDSGGGVPCYIGIDRTASVLFVAHYLGGVTSVFPIRKDGSVGDATDRATYDNHLRARENVRLHCAIPSQNNTYVLVADLGHDVIIVYRLDVGKGKLIPHRSTAVATGAGPRHLAMHPSGRYVYVVNEKNSTVSGLRWDESDGALHVMQTESILPDHFAERNTGSDLHVHPGGHTLYASNRGHDSLALFSIDTTTGKLNARGHIPTGGRIPRSFAMVSRGELMLIANEGSDSVSTFWIDRHTDSLEFSGHKCRVPKAISVALVHRRTPQ